MQTEAEAFLQRIRAFPDDDAPRLIFADWLEEQGATRPGSTAAEWGPERALFIRVQIALAQLAAEEAAGDAGYRPDREETIAQLRREDRRLLDAYREAWEAPFRRLAAAGLAFSRGFIDKLNIGAPDLLRNAGPLFAVGPLRHIELLDVGTNPAAVLRCRHLGPYLGRLTALTVHGQHTGEPLARAVAGAEPLAGLKALHLTRSRLDDAAATHLAGSPVLANLEVLDLKENELGEAGARALAASPHLGRLGCLDLADNRIGPAGAEALAGSERLVSLRGLKLAKNEIGSARLRSAVRAHELLRVPELDLSVNGITPAGLHAILSRPGSADSGAVRLRDLDLSHNELGDDGARVIGQAASLGELRGLRLVGCGIRDDGARALASSPHLNRLVSLDLQNNPVGDPGFRAFLESPHLRGLQHLAISGLSVSAETRRALALRFHRGRR